VLIGFGQVVAGFEVIGLSKVVSLKHDPDPKMTHGLIRGRFIAYDV
jgi:hypothetical protein